MASSQSMTGGSLRRRRSFASTLLDHCPGPLGRRPISRRSLSRSAYRPAAVLFKLVDVLVAAAQPVARLVGGFCCAACFNAHRADRDDGTAIEWCAHCWASR